MPCRSDYMEPTNKEKRLQETAQLLMYVRSNTKTGVKISNALRSAAGNLYCTKDYVPELCGVIRGLSEEDKDRIMYDGRNPTARKLADWWDEHEEADRVRREAEKA